MSNLTIQTFDVAITLPHGISPAFTAQEVEDAIKELVASRKPYFDWTVEVTDKED